MKTRINTLISIAVLPFALFSCNREIKFDMPAPENLVEIRASIPDVATKVVAVDAETGIDWNWAEGDQIAVTSGATVSVYDIRPGFSAKEASFVGKEINGEKFSITYPGKSPSALAALSLIGQSQTGNDDKSHLQYFALLENLDNYTEFAFSSESGALKQCGVLRFSLTLPDEATVVNRVSLKASDAIFHNGNADDALTDELTLTIADGTVGSDHTFTAWMTTSWFDDEIAAGTSLVVNVIAGDFNWLADVTPSAAKAIKAGYVNNVKVTDASKWSSASRYAEGDGTEENPWQIKSAKQMMYMHEDLEDEKMFYFKLIADVDMEGLEWVPLNPSSPYKKYIYFDGGGHTINNLTITTPTAYASFAGVLYGTVKDVTFNNASINAGNNKSGVVCGYMGTGDKFIPSVAQNVTVKNSTVTATTSCGVFVGQTGSDDSTFENCHVINSTINHTGTGNYHVGGFVGRGQKDAVYTDCTAQATVTGTQFVGGFAGYIEKGTFTRCSSTSTVTGGNNVGGFVGKSDTGVVVDCYYAGPMVKATKDGNIGSGGFVGYANKNPGSTYTGCYVKGTTIDMANGQRVGGFVGQIDEGSVFTKCYVEGVTISGGLNTGGFVGVDYSSSVNQCHVDGGTINPSGVGKTDDGVGVAGFAAYTQGAVIKNCYTTIDITGDYDGIGGFFAFCKENTEIKYCYASGEIASDGDPVGIFGAYVEDLDGIVIQSCIGWSDTLPFVCWDDGGDISGNYCGTEGTISYHAAQLGWDPEIWDFSAKLK